MEILSGISSQMIYTCYGEYRMKIPRPYPEKKNDRITMYESIFDNTWQILVSIVVLHAVASQMHIVQSQCALVTHKTVNA